MVVNTETSEVKFNKIKKKFPQGKYNFYLGVIQVKQQILEELIIAEDP